MKKVIIFGLASSVSLLVAAPAARAEDATNFEKRMYRIFKSSPPVSREKWAEIVGERKQEVYTVQKGDTLWDISRTLFGDGFFWSKLWAENGGLENPHLISVDQQIRMMAGNEANGPEISVGGEAAEDPIPEGSEVATLNNDKAIIRTPKGAAPAYREEVMKEVKPEDNGLIETDEILPAPAIPGAHATRGVLKNLPPSFVNHSTPVHGNFDGTGLEVKATKALTTPATIVPNSFIADHAVEHIGEVIEIEAQDTIASFGQNIFLRLDEKARIGERMVILEPREKIKIPGEEEVGPVVDIGGRVQIIGIVDEDKNTYRASVIQALKPIRLGSLVSKMQLPKATFSRSGTRTTIDAKIIGAEYDGDRKLLGEGAVVYLSKGKNAGFNVGDIVPIQSRRQERREDSKYPEWIHTIGLIKVVKLEESVSTGIVLEAHEEIMIGDRTGGTLTPNAYIHDDSSESKTE